MSFEFQHVSYGYIDWTLRFTELNKSYKSVNTYTKCLLVSHSVYKRINKYYGILENNYQSYNIFREKYPQTCEYTPIKDFNPIEGFTNFYVRETLVCIGKLTDHLFDSMKKYNNTRYYCGKRENKVEMMDFNLNKVF